MYSRHLFSYGGLKEIRGTPRAKENLASVGYEPTTSGLDLPMLYRLSYEASTGAGRGNLGSEVAVKSNFLWPVGSPKFPLIRVETQGIWCIGSIAYFQHPVDLFTINK